MGVIFSGCGKTRLLRPQIQALCKQMTELAALEPREPIRPSAPLDPKPVLKERDPGSNTTVVMFEQLTDPTVDLSAQNKPDAYLGEHTLFPIQLAAKRDSELRYKAIEDEDKNFAAGLAVRYIGAIKIVEHKPPVILDGDNFRIGTVKGVVMLFDRQTMKPVFADGFKAQNDPKVSFTTSKPQPSGPWVRSNLIGKMREAVIKTLTDGTGGKFELNEWR